MNGMSKKVLKLAAAAAIALGTASPLMATSASAAPYGHNGNSYSYQISYRSHDRNSWERDRHHRPAMRYERRPRMPHHGHYKYRWHQGQWNWHRGHWVWAPGLWIRF